MSNEVEVSITRAARKVGTFFLRVVGMLLGASNGNDPRLPQNTKRIRIKR